jgi:hypothetical protein
MNDNNLDELTKIIKDNITNIQEKRYEQLSGHDHEEAYLFFVFSLNLGKNYQCFYYDNTTLNMKSTMIDPRTVSKDKKGPTPVTNEMLLQLLEVREDFSKFPHTNEVYTRSTTNHWIAGNRLYNKLTVSEDNESSTDIDDYTEIYLIASKKDTSLADVEGKFHCFFCGMGTNILFLETLTKMSKSLLDTMHIE